MQINTAGLIFELTSDGQAVFDYSEVKPLVTRSMYGGTNDTSTTTTTASGRAVAKARVAAATIGYDNIRSSTATLTETSTNGTAPRIVKPGTFFPFGFQIVEYKLNADGTLTLNFPIPITFRRIP